MGNPGTIEQSARANHCRPVIMEPMAAGFYNHKEEATMPASLPDSVPRSLRRYDSIVLAAEAGDKKDLLGRLDTLIGVLGGAIRGEGRIMQRYWSIWHDATAFRLQILEAVKNDTVEAGPPPVEDIHEARAVIAALWNERLNNAK